MSKKRYKWFSFLLLMLGYCVQGPGQHPNKENLSVSDERVARKSEKHWKTDTDRIQKTGDSPQKSSKGYKVY